MEAHKFRRRYAVRLKLLFERMWKKRFAVPPPDVSRTMYSLVYRFDPGFVESVLVAWFRDEEYGAAAAHYDPEHFKRCVYREAQGGE
ncbi:MAG: hypothetical protein KatS3mg023_3801 [Armatimonadota bacterium]|nr:MAG: hypothetical protein KatS3mg023_3801 [Armatimonadota bacterium]